MYDNTLTPEQKTIRVLERSVTLRSTPSGAHWDPDASQEESRRRARRALGRRLTRDENTWINIEVEDRIEEYRPTRDGRDDPTPYPHQ